MPFKKGEQAKGSTPFKKGVSGNPAGKPKLPDLREAIAKILGGEEGAESGLDRILKALEKKALAGDTKAADILMNRGWGMPKQTIDANLSQQQPIIVRNVIEKKSDETTEK
jgi:hypothetical protein